MQTDFQSNGTAFPTNVRQMGSADDGLKIYMEDYVHTYLYQYARSSATGEKLAVLMGKTIVIDGQKTVFISGVVQARYTEKLKGMETITNQSWKYISEDIEKYFSDLSIVGWMHSRASFGAFVTSRDEAYHKKVFQGDSQVFFVVDPEDRLDRFYVLNEAASALRPVKGYFVYYDKNVQMQEYMLANSLVQPKNSGMDMDEEEKEAAHMDAAAKIRAVLLNKNIEKVKKVKFKYAAFTCVSAVMCLICVFMSMSLATSVSRIDKLEDEVVTVKQTVAEQREETLALAKDVSNYSPVITVMAAENNSGKEDSDEKRTYTIKEGDTLAGICRLFYGDDSRLEEIMAMNNITNPDVIYYGKELQLP
ncbi:MAG: LysM peptidoglycan-binding domain-containing protein [Clostridiales bacterium]|nr:LysM peptidoglycan-binding domain-containing protein [Clostridiales bacterium]